MKFKINLETSFMTHHHRYIIRPWFTKHLLYKHNMYRVKDKTDVLYHKSPNFWHGRVVESMEKVISPPEIFPGTEKTEEKPRSDHDAPAWLTATEYQDVSSSLEMKSDTLAELLLASKKTVLYNGAGISASVIGQAAKSGVNKVGWVGKGVHAQPTMTHYILSQLVRENLIHSWIQQNHDGLPQKAGCPQHKINEIHGAWFDPSNPVVKYSGSLRNDLYSWMKESAKTADLVIALGTSLSGLNADRMVVDCAEREGSLGSVMINLQQTQLDGMMSLKIYGKTDDVLSSLVERLHEKGKLKQTSQDFLKSCEKLQNWSELLKMNRYKFKIPYDKNGNKLLKKDGEMPGDKSRWTTWDLSENARVKLHRKNNCKGSEQPSYVKLPGVIGAVVGFDDQAKSVVVGFGRSKSVYVGGWWIEAAMNGTVDTLPIVNV